MGMSLTLNSLPSRAIRKVATSNAVTRTFKANNHGFKTNDDGGIIGAIIDAGKRFIGWILGKLWSFVSSFISWSLSAIWGYFCRTVGFFWRFQWNQSDEQMKASLTAAWNAFGSTLGGAVGNTLGSLIVLGGSTILFAFNEAMAVYVLREVGEESLEELCQQAATVTNAIIPLATNYLFSRAYMKIRNSLGLNPDAAYRSDADLKAELDGRVASGSLTQAQATELFNKNKAGRDALKAERKPWSFANQWEEYVEQVQKDNPFWGNFLESLFEETVEAIQERGYVAFGAIDSFIASHKMGTQVAGGQTSEPITVELTLDRSIDDTPITPPTTP